MKRQKKKKKKKKKKHKATQGLETWTSIWESLKFDSQAQDWSLG